MTRIAGSLIVTIMTMMLLGGLTIVGPAFAEGVKWNTIDLTGRTDPTRLRDGSHLIYTTGSGVRIFANVQKGRIVGYTVQDSRGRVLPAVQKGRVVSYIVEKATVAPRPGVRDTRREEELRKAGEEHEKRKKAREEALERLIEQATQQAQANDCLVFMLAEMNGDSWVTVDKSGCKKGGGKNEP